MSLQSLNQNDYKLLNDHNLCSDCCWMGKQKSPNILTLQQVIPQFPEQDLGKTASSQVTQSSIE